MIRRAEERDISSLMHLLDQVNRVHHEGRPDLFRRGTKYGESQLAEILRSEDTPVFAFEENGAVLGHAFCKVERVTNDRLLCDRVTLYIDDICVDETARGKGIGRALYAHCEAFAREMRCHNVTLNVWMLNPGALAFYRAMGLSEQKITMERVLDSEKGTHDGVINIWL